MNLGILNHFLPMIYIISQGPVSDYVRFFKLYPDNRSRANIPDNNISADFSIVSIVQDKFDAKFYEGNSGEGGSRIFCT